jgi:hypothetical protein
MDASSHTSTVESQRRGLIIFIIFICHDEPCAAVIAAVLLFGCSCTSSVRPLAWLKDITTADKHSQAAANP